MTTNIFYLVPTRYFLVPEVESEAVVRLSSSCQRLPRLDFTLFLNPAPRSDLMQCSAFAHLNIQGILNLVGKGFQEKPSNH